MMMVMVVLNSPNKLRMEVQLCSSMVTFENRSSDVILPNDKRQVKLRERKGYKAFEYNK